MTLFRILSNLKLCENGATIVHGEQGGGGGTRNHEVESIKLTDYSRGVGTRRTLVLMEEWGGGSTDIKYSIFNSGLPCRG